MPWEAQPVAYLTAWFVFSTKLSYIEIDSVKEAVADKPDLVLNNSIASRPITQSGFLGYNLAFMAVSNKGDQASFYATH